MVGQIISTDFFPVAKATWCKPTTVCATKSYKGLEYLDIDIIFRPFSLRTHNKGDLLRNRIQCASPCFLRRFTIVSLHLRHALLLWAGLAETAGAHWQGGENVDNRTKACTNLLQTESPTESESRMADFCVL